MGSVPVFDSGDVSTLDCRVAARIALKQQSQSLKFYPDIDESASALGQRLGNPHTIFNLTCAGSLGTLHTVHNYTLKSRIPFCFCRGRQAVC
jgi:hypothetical protein